MIYIIRHGQTEQNQRMCLAGRRDYPLNRKGMDQAREARMRFAEAGITFDTVISSPLDRALRTAEVVAPEAEIRVDERLTEMEFGPYEGMDLKKPSPEVLHFFSDFERNPAPEGMESLESVVSRLGCLLEDLKAVSADRNILLSTHAIAMKGALTYLSGPGGESWWSKNIDNCAVYFTEAINGQYSLPQLLQ